MWWKGRQLDRARSDQNGISKIELVCDLLFSNWHNKSAVRNFSLKFETREHELQDSCGSFRLKSFHQKLSTEKFSVKIFHPELSFEDCSKLFTKKCSVQKFKVCKSPNQRNGFKKLKNVQDTLEESAIEAHPLRRAYWQRKLLENNGGACRENGILCHGILRMPSCFWERPKYRRWYPLDAIQQIRRKTLS